MQQQPIIFSFTMSPSSAMSPVCDKAHRPAASAGPLIALWQKDTCPVPTNRQPPKAGKYETHKGNFADERRRSIGEVSFLLLNQCPAAGSLWRGTAGETARFHVYSGSHFPYPTLQFSQ